MSTLFFPKIVLMVSLLTVAFAVTPKDEVQALRDIAKTMGKADYWDFSVDPCSNNSGWVKDTTKGSENAVTCNCTISNDGVCHVVSIVLKKQSLPGKLPPELVRLPYLQEIDLTRNYLNGTIPPEWGSMKLVKISLIGNRVSGSIPKEIANISTLQMLLVEYNQISGVIPPGIGNLPSLERLCLTSNNFSGELPATLAKLTTLQDFRISDNHFTGSIPSYIQNWTMLEKLFIQGSGLNGPIPSGLADLVNLIELRISDLNGSIQPFPPLQNMQKMKIMMMRSCNISGELPGYLGNMTTLKTLDLSFNKLSGEIPSNFTRLADVDYIYLTGNLLTGTVPDWMLNLGDKIDLSYNNFTNPSSETCENRLVNFFGNSLKRNNSGMVPCLRSVKCPKRLYYSLNINCGGKQVHVSKDITYEDDTSPGGPKEKSFFRSSTNWAYSNTGNFLDDERPEDLSVWKNTTRLSMNNSELYMTARLSALSLTYYGYCLGNGNYTVDLHFAEIMFTGDKTYSSLGKRLFDVYIQGKLVLKDFNIAAEAGGVGKAIIKNFTAAVTDNTLEIRFYWAGKGTDAIPYKGVYGPLISAISVNPADFIPPKVENSGLSAGMIGGIVAGVCLILLVVGLIWWKCCIGQRNTMSEDLRSLDLKTGSFTLRQIKAATNNFDIANKIGEGGFGSVYKGLLLDGTVIAVKQLSSKSKQGNREFVNEIGMISALDHPHLVKLYGCCIEGKELLLIYEYLENNCLARALFGDHRLDLNWPTRQKICVGIARGLAYLHEESRLKIVHRDIKATNVLLDKDLNAKISDFGLAKLDEEDDTHISTRIAGTFGYMAPEYAMRGYLTDKADVYSFGIVALEIVSGRSNTNNRRKEECFNLLDWALVLKEKGNLMDIVDPRLGSDFNLKEVMTMTNVALICANVSPSVRPTMSSVVSILEGKSSIPEFVTAPNASDEESKYETMKKHYEQLNDECSVNYSEVQSMSIGMPSTVSSSSAADLYPIGSDYWEKRDRS